MKLYLLFFLLLCLWPLFLTGQQTPHFSMGGVDKYQFNPAVSAYSERLIAVGVHRDQWRNIPGAPSTQILSAYFPLDFGESAVGMQLLNDAIGLERTLSLSFSYAHLFNTEYGSIALAFKAGAEQKSIDQSRLRTPGGTYSEDIIDHNDPLLGVNDIRSLLPTFGFSAWYSHGRFDVGISVENIAIGEHFGDEFFQFKPSPVYSLYGDYFLPLTLDWFMVPSLLLYTDLNQTQVYLHALGSYRNLYFGGLGIRGLVKNSVDAITVMAGLRINERFSLYYNYDIGLSNIYRPANQTHEFTIVYRGPEWTQKRQRPPVIYNPRFME